MSFFLNTLKMIGVELNSIDDTITDLVGEITNMVTGGAKQILIDAGHKFEMTAPSVASGKDHEIQHQSLKKIIHIPFESSCGIFYAEFNALGNSFAILNDFSGK